jgi:hypothetical protein
VWAEADPEHVLADVWVYLTPDEARELLLSLRFWAEEVDEGHPDPGWHTHVTDGNREFTIAINADEARGRFADRTVEPSK